MSLLLSHDQPHLGAVKRIRIHGWDNVSEKETACILEPWVFEFLMVVYTREYLA